MSCMAAGARRGTGNRGGVPDIYFAYIDEALDDQLCVVTAILVPVLQWRATMAQMEALRGGMHRSDRIYPKLEWHARDFATGRGQISPPGTYISKGRRAELFRMIMRWAAEQSGIEVVNALYPLRIDKRVQLVPAFAATVLGIHRVMQSRDAYAILVPDAGHQAEYRDAVRQLADAGRIDRIIEDPFEKDSRLSYFVQLADFCGYALLRRERPTPVIEKYGLDRAFGDLEPALITTELDVEDEEGIIRPGSF